MKRLLLLAFVLSACTTNQPTSAPSETPTSEAPIAEEEQADTDEVEESKTDAEGDASPTSVDLVKVTVLRTDNGMIVGWTRASRDAVPEGTVFSATVQGVIFAAKYVGRPISYAFDLSTSENTYGSAPNEIGPYLSIAIVGDYPKDLGAWDAAVEIEGRVKDEVA